MREIKFRAWDLVTCRICEITRIDFINREICAVGVYSKDGKVATSRDDGEDLILMQYTGLKDKSGVEIFEGDLLKHDLWGVSEIIWDKEGSCFRGQNEDHDITLAHHQLLRSKVIGNLYENPELLNLNK